MNELDQFIKHELKVRCYVRYTDDFVIVHRDRGYLESALPCVENFLWQKLQLKLHPKKIEIRKFSQGIDFLGYVILPHHVRLRAKTKKRMMRKLKNVSSNEQSLQSYLGILSHADAHDLSEKVKNNFWLAKDE